MGLRDNIDRDLKKAKHEQSKKLTAEKAAERAKEQQARKMHEDAQKLAVNHLKKMGIPGCYVERTETENRQNTHNQRRYCFLTFYFTNIELRPRTEILVTVESDREERRNKQEVVAVRVQEQGNKSVVLRAARDLAPFLRRESSVGGRGDRI